MKRYYYVGKYDKDIYSIDPDSVDFPHDDPGVMVFSSRDAAGTYWVRCMADGCMLPARVARAWIDAYTWEYAHTVDAYLRRYPQNDLRNY